MYFKCLEKILKILFRVPLCGEFKSVFRTLVRSTEYKGKIVPPLKTQRLKFIDVTTNIPSIRGIMTKIDV